MNENSELRTNIPFWPLWKKILFRFFAIYFFLFISPFTWIELIPGGNYVTRYWDRFMDWMVYLGNRLLFHVKPVLVPMNGSGDTSYGWAQLWLILTLSITGCLIWTAVDRKRRSYERLNYWLVLVVRYYVAIIAFTYGIIKLFALQMPEPNLHQLATPLGDFLPMRLSWMFIGYSTTYQIFSGVMETIAGLLLLYRRTAVMGSLFALAVFTNVMMLNLTYDIPVKIFSMQIVLCCLFLVGNSSGRMLRFFILNKPAPVCDLYRFPYTKKWQRAVWLIVKLWIVYAVVVQPFMDSYGRYKELHAAQKKQPVPNGMYDVAVYKVNNQSLPASAIDSARWRDLIFENGAGSIKATDTAFRQRYARSYFVYSLDSATHTLVFRKLPQDSLSIVRFQFEMPDSNTIQLRGLRSGDSLYVELKRIPHHFQLTEKQFHWLSEANR